jgi:hypothetical protein
MFLITLRIFVFLLDLKELSYQSVYQALYLSCFPMLEPLFNLQTWIIENFGKLWATTKIAG